MRIAGPGEDPITALFKERCRHLSVRLRSQPTAPDDGEVARWSAVSRRLCGESVRHMLPDVTPPTSACSPFPGIQDSAGGGFKTHRRKKPGSNLSSLLGLAPLRAGGARHAYLQTAILPEAGPKVRIRFPPAASPSLPCTARLCGKSPALSRRPAHGWSRRARGAIASRRWNALRSNPTITTTFSEHSARSFVDELP